MHPPHIYPRECEERLPLKLPTINQLGSSPRVRGRPLIPHPAAAFNAIVLLLAACAAPPRHDIPAELRACPGPAEAPPKLGRIITPEVLRARYYAERAARLETEDALETCAQRLARVLEIVKQ